MNSIGIFQKDKKEIRLENFTTLGGDNMRLVVGFDNESDKIFLNEDISLWTLYKSNDRQGHGLKIYEILKNENVNKIFKDNKDDLWKIKPHMNNLVMVMENEGSAHMPIDKTYYLDEICELEFEEYSQDK